MADSVPLSLADIERIERLLAELHGPYISDAELPWALCDEAPNGQWFPGRTIFSPNDPPGIGVRVADVSFHYMDDKARTIGMAITELANAGERLCALARVGLDAKQAH